MMMKTTGVPHKKHNIKTNNEPNCVAQPMYGKDDEVIDWQRLMIQSISSTPASGGNQALTNSRVCKVLWI
jgi:hypothetical protein